MARIPLAKRLVISTFNIIFPPFAVAMLTGWTSMDTLLNSLLFLLAVIPSHVHGFFISAMYFTRKRRVRKGRFPGKERRFVYSEKVQTGGAGWKEYDRLRKIQKRGSRRSKNGRKERSAEDAYFEADFAKEESYAETPALPKRHATRRRQRQQMT